MNETLADAFTSKLFGVIPASLVVLARTLLIFWIPFSRSVLGRAAYAAGSAENCRLHVAACRSSVRSLQPMRWRDLMSGIGGLYLTFFSYTGEAAFASGNAYTLYSIAAVVLGGVSLARWQGWRGRGRLRRAGFSDDRRSRCSSSISILSGNPCSRASYSCWRSASAAWGATRVRNRLEWFQ